MGVPAVLVTPGEFEGDDVPGDAEAALEPLPGRALGDALPGVLLRVDERGELVVQVVRDGDRDKAGRVPLVGPGGEGAAEFGGAAVVDLGGADGAQPHVAAGLQPAVVRGAVLDPDLDPVTDRDRAAVALPHRGVRVGGRECPQVHPRSAAPSGRIVAGHQGVVRNFASIPRQCVRGSAGWNVGEREMIGGLLRFAPGRLGARQDRAPSGVRDRSVGRVVVAMRDSRRRAGHPSPREGRAWAVLSGRDGNRQREGAVRQCGWQGAGLACWRQGRGMM